MHSVVTAIGKNVTYCVKSALQCQTLFAAWITCEKTFVSWRNSAALILNLAPSIFLFAEHVD